MEVIHLQGLARITNLASVRGIVDANLGDNDRAVLRLERPPEMIARPYGLWRVEEDNFARFEHHRRDVVRKWVRAHQEGQLF
jgi:hypothetical protein